MVQLSLPKNSEVKKGKYFKDKTGSKNLRKVNIYRWDPSTEENPRIDTYEVDMDNFPITHQPPPETSAFFCARTTHHWPVMM